jgi:hypothetical protein
MSDWSERMDAGTKLLHQQAVRIPLPDVQAEWSLHKNMERIAVAGERKSKLLDDPDVPLTEVYEDELAEMRQSFKHRLQQIAGEDYYEVATAYLDGERDDWIGALAAYYLECYYRLQERYTVDEQIFCLVILRYPDCFTVNLSFLTGDISSDAVRYESTKHVDADLDDHHQEQYYADCQYSQHKASEYLRESVTCIRDAFPNPDTNPREQRQYGGFVHITGRDSTTFAEVLDPLAPNQGRFDDDTSSPGLVAEGPETSRAKENYLPNHEVAL